MNLDPIRSRLEGVRGSDASFTAKCPAHEDRDPSLSVTDKGDRIVLHCHAGCETRDVLEAIGMGWDDVYAESRPTRIKPSLRVSEKRHIARAHDIDFTVLQLAETARTPEDAKRIKQAKAKLKAIAERYGMEEFEEITKIWESGDHTRRQRLPEQLPEAMKLVREEASRVSR